VGGATERTMPIQPPVLLFLVIFLRHLKCQYGASFIRQSLIHSLGLMPGETFPEIGTGAGEV